MKKQILVIGLAMFALGFCVNNVAMSSGVSKIAVVDVQTIVGKSAQVQTLKKEQAKKTTELQAWLKNARADVEKQKTKEGKEKLLNKYNSEFAKKQEAIRKEYQTKLQAIDKNITGTITSHAKANGYDMVLSKGVVIYGGEDITAAVSKVVK